ncbi:hypothetical protein [Oceanicola granulosus]|uniref:hypothetical protein n=1 Tax=Oceanicola granulosus TaxID=252302 RepID=UPI0012EAA17C|nr:hypothetical protein [Oceanicola granulosus]
MSAACPAAEALARVSLLAAPSAVRVMSWNWRSRFAEAVTLSSASVSAKDRPSAVCVPSASPVAMLTLSASCVAMAERSPPPDSRPPVPMVASVLLPATTSAATGTSAVPPAAPPLASARAS